MDDHDPVNLRCSVLLLREDRVLLCRRTDEENVWVLPGGTPRRGEGTAVAAAREVVEETGLQVVVEGVAFVLETTSWDASHHLIEIVFVGDERYPGAAVLPSEGRLAPSFVLIDDLPKIELWPPIGGYIRGYARKREGGAVAYRSTAAYLGNVWRVHDDPAYDDPPRDLPRDR